MLSPVGCCLRCLASAGRCSCLRRRAHLHTAGLRALSHSLTGVYAGRARLDQMMVSLSRTSCRRRARPCVHTRLRLLPCTPAHNLGLRCRCIVAATAPRHDGPSMMRTRLLPSTPSFNRSLRCARSAACLHDPHVCAANAGEGPHKTGACVHGANSPRAAHMPPCTPPPPPPTRTHAHKQMRRITMVAGHRAT